MVTQLQEFLNSDVSRLTRGVKKARVGDLFGVEIECEGRNVDWDGGDAVRDLLEDWAPHRDGSLRNNHGESCEWVFNGPVKYKAAVNRVKTLFDYFDKRGAKLVPSNRTSVHVHFNVGDKTAYQVVNLFILFTLLEDLLDRYCGEDRNGNLFCLSSRHAEQQVNWMERACFTDYHFGNFREEFRYCSLNMASINKFYSVEFRGMRGLDNADDVLDWLSILSELCEYACYRMNNPSSLVEMISQKTPNHLLASIFSTDNIRKLTAGLTEQDINASVYEGVRLVQMLCYRIGTEFDQVRLKGKDFWDSFSDDTKVERDIDPKNFVAPEPGRPFARGRRDGLAARMQAQAVQGIGDPAFAANPFAENPWVMREPHAPMPERENLDEAGLRAAELRLREQVQQVKLFKVKKLRKEL